MAQELHDEPITGLDISPSGDLVVTAAGADIRLWELPSGRLRARIDNLDGPIHDLAFVWEDPVSEGEIMLLSVLYADDKGLKRWSLNTDRVSSRDQEIAAFTVGDAGQVAALRPSAVLFSVNADIFDSWSIGDRNYRHLAVAQWVPCVRCPPVNRIVALHDDGGLLIMDPQRSEQFHARPRWGDPCGAGTHDALPLQVALSNDGRRVAVAMSGRVFAAQLDRLPLRPTWRQPELRLLRSACLSAPSATTPEAVRLDVAALQFDDDGDRVSVAGVDGSVRSWDLGSGALALEVVGVPVTPGHAHALAAHSVTRRWLAHAVDGEVTVRDLHGGTPPAKFPVVGPRRRLVEVALSTQGRLAVAREDRVEVWNLASSRLECLDALAGRVAWSPDGGRLAAWEATSVGSNTTPRILVRSAEDLAAAGPTLALADATFPLPPVAWVNDKQLLIPNGPALEVWDIDAGVRLSRIALHQNETVHSLAFAAGRVAALTHLGANDLLFSLSLDDPEGLRTSPVTRASGPVAIAPDGRTIATVHGDAPLPKWDALDLGPRAFYDWSGLQRSADVVAFSSRGVIHGSHRGVDTSLISDWQDAGSSLEIRGRLLDLEVSADGRQVAIAAADGAYVHLLDAGGREVSRLQLVSGAAPGCEGLVVVDGSRVAADARSPATVPVRLGSPLSGPLLAADEVPAAWRQDAPPLPDEPHIREPPAGASVPMLLRAALQSRELYVSLKPTGDGPVTVCLDVFFERGSPSSFRYCYDVHARDYPPPPTPPIGTTEHRVTLPDARIADVWVQACDPTRTLCGRAIRAVGPHTAEGRRFGF
ncbi:MAG: WD40 repeat domain-containing protein [Myxococcales bacterium]|nr:WD40 repeat domain-containing protein [Myxococcales bacterium]